MSNMTRFDPFNELVDDLFKGFLVRPVAYEGRGEVLPRMKVDVAEKNGDRVLRSERYYGKVYRAFTLGQAVEEAGTSAKYANGVLELTLPKQAAVQAKRITIQ